MTTHQEGAALEDDLHLLWGYRQIAKAINTTPRKASHLLADGKIPASKVGRRYVISREKLRAFLTTNSRRPNQPQMRRLLTNQINQHGAPAKKMPARRLDSGRQKRELRNEYSNRRDFAQRLFDE